MTRRDKWIKLPDDLYDWTKYTSQSETTIHYKQIGTYKFERGISVLVEFREFPVQIMLGRHSWNSFSVLMFGKRHMHFRSCALQHMIPSIVRDLYTEAKNG